MDKYFDAEPHTNGVPVTTATAPSFDPDHGESAYPAAAIAAMPEQPQRDFSSGICDLSQSWTIFCDACLCSPCIASAHHNLLLKETEGVDLPMCFGLLISEGLVDGLCPTVPRPLFLHTFVMRMVLRERYNLRDPFKRASPAAANTWDSTGILEPVLDLLQVAFCLACVLAQHQREIAYQGEWCGGVFSNRNSILAPTEVHTL